MKTIVESLGREPVEFDNKIDASDYIKRCIAGDLIACRRQFKEAKKEKMGPDSYKITFGGNVYSTYTLK